MPARKHPVQEFNGVRYYHKPPGYYHTCIARGIHRYMHRDIWIFHHGPIPEGHHVHHKDGNRANNAIENLCCMPKGKRGAIHMLERIATYPEQNALALDKAREAAKAWHASEEGRRWHSVHGKDTWKDRAMAEFRCCVCGKTFSGVTGIHREKQFCSDACQSRARRDSGIDDVTRICTMCGKEFRTNRYTKKRTCGNKDCWGKAIGETRRRLRLGRRGSALLLCQ